MEVYTEDWPIVVFKIVSEPKDINEVNEILKQWTCVYAMSMEKNQKFRLIFDTTAIKSIKLELLKPIGQFLVKVKSMTEKWMDRTSILVSSDNVYRLIKFVFTFYKPVRPFKVFKSMVKATEWIVSEDPGETLENEIFKKPDQNTNKISNISFD